MPLKRRTQKMFDSVTERIKNQTHGGLKVNPETGVRYEEPLEEKHPGLTIGVMAVQPGTILEKVLAPSVYKGMINSINEGNLSEALMAGMAPVKGVSLTRVPESAWAEMLNEEAIAEAGALKNGTLGSSKFRPTPSRPITLEEKLGIPKGERSNLSQDQTEALEDLLHYQQSGRHKKYFLYNPETENFRWSASKPSQGSKEIGARRALIEHGAQNKRGATRLSTKYGNFVIWDDPNINSAFTTNFPIPKGLQWGPGETSVKLLSPHEMQITLTAPKTDIINSYPEASKELIESLPNTIDKNIMRRFWSENGQMIKPGTYLSGDNGAAPLGRKAIDTFDENGVSAAISEILHPKKVGIAKANGLSPDSYSSIIRQAQRENKSLRWGQQGFTKWNDSMIENKNIYEAWEKMNRGEITPEQYKEIFDAWAVPMGGRPAQIYTTPKLRTFRNNDGTTVTVPQEVKKTVIIPHPYIFYKKFGGKI